MIKRAERNFGLCMKDDRQKKGLAFPRPHPTRLPLTTPLPKSWESVTMWVQSKIALVGVAAQPASKQCKGNTWNTDTSSFCLSDSLRGCQSHSYLE